MFGGSYKSVNLMIAMGLIVEYGAHSATCPGPQLLQLARRIPLKVNILTLPNKICKLMCFLYLQTLITRNTHVQSLAYSLICLSVLCP